MSVTGHRYCIKKMYSQILVHNVQPWEDENGTSGNYRVIERTWNPNSGPNDTSTDVERVVAVCVNRTVAHLLLHALTQIIPAEEGLDAYEDDVWY